MVLVVHPQLQHLTTVGCLQTTYNWCSPLTVKGGSPLQLRTQSISQEGTPGQKTFSLLLCLQPPVRCCGSALVTPSLQPPPQVLWFDAGDVIPATTISGVVVRCW